MNARQIPLAIDIVETIRPLLDTEDFPGVVEVVGSATSEQLTSLLERLPLKQRAVVYRFLPKERAVEVFERLSPGLQGDLIRGLRDSEVSRGAAHVAKPQPPPAVRN